MLSRNRHSRRRGERGQVLILALVFIALFGIVTAATLEFADGTFLQHVRTEATAASDATTQGGPPSPSPTPQPAPGAARVPAAP